VLRRPSDALGLRAVACKTTAGATRDRLPWRYCGGVGVTGQPSGTVTFLFTDIEGSTRRWERDSDAMRADLALHDDVVTTAIESCGGWLFKHTGDGVCAAFESPQAAIDAAMKAQCLLELPVRMGLATGEAERRGDDYFGPALNRAARVMAVGHGGQILVSGSTAGLVSGNDLMNLGEHRLRDLSEVEQLFQLRASGLRTEFPPLTTVDAVPGNLPAQVTSFVGRDVEVQDLAELIRLHRLVTLTGVGGVGKTRLAIQIAADLIADFSGGVWLVELAPVGDPAALPDAVATALGIIPQPGRSVTASIAETVAGRTMLVVLDNCDHVLDAAAELVEAILVGSSTVSVIATSREGLRASGEYLWPVPSLDVRDGAESVAVELFVQRARAVVPVFSLSSSGEVDAVTEICRRLDGIALAIELAAVRMVSMTPVEVLARLNDRFRLLSGSRRGLERHQTLRQAVQWSYDLLTEDEQYVLGVSAVFAGGFDVAAVTAICNRFDEYTVLDILDSLVRKSLVTTSRAGGKTRYRLLETIRQFAEDQQAGIESDSRAGTISEVRDRHASYFATQARGTDETFFGPRQRVALDWVAVELDNLRAALQWAIDSDDLDNATAIAAHTAVVAFDLQILEQTAWAEASSSRRCCRRRGATASALRRRIQLRIHRPARRWPQVRAGFNRLAGRPAIPVLRSCNRHLSGGQRAALRRRERALRRDLYRPCRPDRIGARSRDVRTLTVPPNGWAHRRGDHDCGRDHERCDSWRDPVDDRIRVLRSWFDLRRRRPGPSARHLP
jgi:predicted ATPase/class 3 adenylate cyclase